MGALEHREHERVDDPDERDEHRQGEEGVDQAEHLVDGGLGVLELGPGLDLTFGYGPGVVTARSTAQLPCAQQDGAGEAGGKWDRKNAGADQVAADQGVGLEDPADAQGAPVWANLTGTVSPTARCLVFAVVVSMSSSPGARAAGLPAVMRRIDRAGQLPVDTAASLDSVCRNSNCPSYTLVTAVTPGTGGGGAVEC